MIRSIEWSPRAKGEYLNTLEYLSKHWGRRVTKRYMQRVEEIISQMAQTPTLFPNSYQKAGVRRAIISKHSTLYFRVYKEKIQIISLSDNRQDPSKVNI